jgi:hypothetical protein
MRSGHRRRICFVAQGVGAAGGAGEVAPVGPVDPEDGAGAIGPLVPPLPDAPDCAKIAVGTPNEAAPIAAAITAAAAGRASGPDSNLLGNTGNDDLLTAKSKAQLTAQ